MAKLSTKGNKALTAIEGRIAELLYCGVSQEAIAQTIGVSPGRLTQILEARPAIKNEVLKKEAVDAEAHLVKANVYQDYVEQAEARLPELIEEETSLATLVKSLDTLDKMRERAIERARRAAIHQDTSVLQLNLSDLAKARLNIVVNQDNRVLAVNGTATTPMDYQGVVELFDTVATPKANVSLLHASEEAPSPESKKPKTFKVNAAVFEKILMTSDSAEGDCLD
jgi:transcriptional regulator with XRE-family HTH domain